MAQKPKILVVDDEQVILDSARRALAAEQFDLSTARDAESAMPILRSDPPDILISDLMLPGASGIDLLAAAGEHDPAPVIIITTGYSTVENAVDTLNRGAFDFLPKPFTYEELLSVVARARRALALPVRPTVAMPGETPGGDYQLGIQTWARLEGDGTALLGATESATEVIGPPASVEFPDVNGDIRQGGRLVTVASNDGLTHRFWSPLSGRVLGCNERLREDPSLLREDPRRAGWLVRIHPSDPDRELTRLTGRSAT